MQGLDAHIQVIIDWFHPGQGGAVTGFAVIIHGPPRIVLDGEIIHASRQPRASFAAVRHQQVSRLEAGIDDAMPLPNRPAGGGLSGHVLAEQLIPSRQPVCQAEIVKARRPAPLAVAQGHRVALIVVDFEIDCQRRRVGASPTGHNSPAVRPVRPWAC